MKKNDKFRLLVPTGRMRDSLEGLLTECGLSLKGDARNYRPRCVDPELDVKLLKPANIARLVELGRHDLGFSGRDWIAESSAKVEVLLDLGLEPVKLVLAAPKGTTLKKLKTRKKLVLATEYQNLAKRYVKKKGWDCTILRTNGATEVYPPDDADLIVDNTATGSTLRANNLDILDVLMESSTCFVGNRQALKNKKLREKAEDIVMLLKGTLEARQKVMLEMNVTKARLEKVLKELPSMKKPTVQTLAGGTDFAVKTAVDKKAVTGLILKLKKMGVTDIIEVPLRKVLP